LCRNFLAYVEHVLVPTLRRTDIVVMDNFRSHKVAGVQEAIEKVRATVQYLPKYSPDLNPIEMPYSKFKTFLRKIAARACLSSIEQSARSCLNSALRNVQTTSSMPAMLQYDRNPL
jgi:hypothetical protein